MLMQFSRKAEKAKKATLDQEVKATDPVPMGSKCDAADAASNAITSSPHRSSHDVDQQSQPTGPQGFQQWLFAIPAMSVGFLTPSCLEIRSKKPQDVHSSSLDQPKMVVTDLPNEVLYHITSYLALHDVYHLSRTSQHFRTVTNCDWREIFSGLSESAKVDFLVELNYHIPDTWLCTNCCKLHPSLDCSHRRTLRYCLASRIPCGVYSVTSYPIVQLALKLSRLGIHSDVLQRLMTPSQGVPFIGGGEYHAHPKIINNQFYLHERRVLGETYEKLSRISVTHELRAICPHLLLTAVNNLEQCTPEARRNTRRYPCGQLEIDFDQAFEHRGTTVKGSCSHCFTDYSVLVCKNVQMLTVNTWRNLGKEGHPQNPVWKSHEFVLGQNDGGNFYTTWNRDPESVREEFRKG